MSNRKNQQPDAIVFGIDSPPMGSDQLISMRSWLRAKYFTYLNGVIALTVLAVGITIRVMTLEFDQARELLHISLYIGGWIGLFAGISIKGDTLTRVQMTMIGMVVCTAASLGSAMLMTLLVGYAPSWISSINILASALGGMWLLTYYDDIVKAISLMKNVSASQLAYIIKAANHFDSLMGYATSIHQQGREPVMGEYWVIRDWVSDKAKSA